MELSLDMTARTDRPTVVNLTNHSFFNLAGARSGREHSRSSSRPSAADHFLAIDAGAIPLPRPPSEVAGTPFDFRDRLSRSARGSGDDHPQLRTGRGYDHNFCLGAAGEPRFAARLAEPTSGRVLELPTNQPGLQVYSGNFLDGSTAGKGGRLYRADPTPSASNRRPGLIRPTGRTFRPRGWRRARSIAHRHSRYPAHLTQSIPEESPQGARR